MRRRWALACALVAGLLVSAPTRAAEPTPLLVAAASDLQPVLSKLVAAFGEGDKTPLQVVYGSSGKLSTQIGAGAPYDMFFSADASYPRQLERAGLIVSGTREPYGVGRLVLWAAADSGVDVKQGPKALLAARVLHVAIANPAHAPYGRAAEAALRHANIYTRIQPKLVLGENVSQAAQFAQTGAAQAAFIAGTLLATPALAAGHAWRVPTDWYPPIVQEAVVLKRSKEKDEARAFLAFVTSPRGRKILASSGIDAP